MFWLILLAIVLGVALLVMLIRTLLFTPKKGPKVSEQEISFDKEAAVSNLQQLVRCKTISYKDASLEDDEVLCCYAKEEVNYYLKKYEFWKETGIIGVCLTI